VTPQGLRKVAEQIKLAKSPNYKNTCTGRFTSTYGLPCCHTLYRQLHRSSTSELKVGLNAIHEHWLFRRPYRNSPYIPIDLALLIQDPAVVQRCRGRPEGPTNPRKPDNLTRQEPSIFKTVGNNTGNIGRGRGRRRARGGRSQTPKRSSSTQLSSAFIKPDPYRRLFGLIDLVQLRFV